MRRFTLALLIAALLLAPPAIAAQLGQGRWNLVSAPVAGAQASASQLAAGPTTDVYVNRLRTLDVAVAAGATAQTPVEVVVRDGPSGSGTIIWAAFLAAPVDGFASVQRSGLDLRASIGNALTVEFTGAGVAGSQETVTASGDVVAYNYPAFGP